MAPNNGNNVLIEGWLYKKRRRRLKGFASRYFRLYASGILSYTIHPSISPRDQILLPSAVISSFSSSPCDVHIDSDFSTFHIKFKSIVESQQWMPLFRKFVQPSITVPERAETCPEDLLHEMEQSIHELNKSLSVLKQEEFSLKSPNFFRFKRDKEAPGTLTSILRDKDSRLNKLLKYDPGPPSPGASSDKEVKPNSFSRLDRISDAVQAISTQFQLLSECIAEMRQPVDIRRQTPSYAAGTQARRASMRPRSASIRTAVPGSPTNESIWYDAQDFSREGEAGEELVLEPEASDDAPSLDESISRPRSPEQAGDEVLEEVSSAVTSLRDLPSRSNTEFVRRVFLPSPIRGDEGSLFTALKRNVGKDLSNVTFPVSFNEPLSLLQRLGEDVEYTNLLDCAVSTDDPIERICYIAAFAVSGYAGTKLRSGRKAFTPMLGETFEDTRSNFVAEKVSHSPLIMACHAHGDGWEYWSTSAGKTRFWGKSLEIVQTGTTHLRVGKDSFKWQRPSTFVRNLVLGTKYLEHCGQIEILSDGGALSCFLDFKETGYWGTSPNEVYGKVYDWSHEVVARLEGRWDEQLSQVLDDSHLKVLWKVNPFSRHSPEYYGLSPFAMTLNEITPDMEGRLPPCDSRFRPDIRAMEEGDIDLADSEKCRLEEQQRVWREQEDPRLLRPKWFVREPSSDDFVYRGGYWEERSQGWKDTRPWW